MITNSLKSGGSGGRDLLPQRSLGSKIVIPTTYGGLGYRIFEQLSIETDKILQVDTMNNITESKRSIKTRSVRLAIEMRGRGVGQNDVILISSQTHAHQTIVMVAALFLGAIVSPISPDSPFKVFFWLLLECLEVVKKLKPKMCFCDSRTVSQIDRILYTLNMTSEIVSFGNDTCTTQFSKLFPFKEDTDFVPHHVDHPETEVAFVVPTQGTCHDPKLVCLSHHNIYLQCVHFVDVLDGPTKVISFFPLCWITQVVLACASLEFGITRVMAPSFNERIACKMIHDFVIDSAVLGTELAMRLTGNVAVKDFNLACLKCVLVGVVNTSKEDLMQMRRALPSAKFLQVYALTETGFVAAVANSNYSDALGKPTSVGTVLNGCKVKVVDPETTQIVGMGQVGEVYFKGDGLMLGYFKSNADTLASLEKGYFKTGDLASIDEQGWVYLEGRKDDVIYRDNTAFIPRQAEACIKSHPYVHDACIIGNATELIICIQKRPESKLTPDNILKYFSKRMPNFDLKFTGVLLLDEFPRTSAGNVKRRLLKEQLLKVKIEYTTSLASINPNTFEKRHTKEEVPEDNEK